MEDDRDNIIEELVAAIQGNDAETLRDILKSTPEAVGFTVDGLPLLHYVCRQPGSGCDIIQTVLQFSDVDVNLTSEEVGKWVSTVTYFFFLNQWQRLLLFRWNLRFKDI
jgi:hypothetical protein